jgi:riboflavin biosynthesis pyrimidine reductase
MVRLRENLGKARHPVQIAATRSGLDLDRHLLFNVPEVPVVVLAGGKSLAVMRDQLAARPWIRAVPMKEPDQLVTALEELRDIGIERISSIGGHTLATALLDAGVIQDIYLTTAPRPGGEPDTPMYPGVFRTKTVVRKRGTLQETGVVFEHLLLSQEPAESRTASATTSP